MILILCYMIGMMLMANWITNTWEWFVCSVAKHEWWSCLKPLCFQYKCFSHMKYMLEFSLQAFAEIREHYMSICTSRWCVNQWHMSYPTSTQFARINVHRILFQLIHCFKLCVPSCSIWQGFLSGQDKAWSACTIKIQHSECFDLRW